MGILYAHALLFYISAPAATIIEAVITTLGALVVAVGFKKRSGVILVSGFAALLVAVGLIVAVQAVDHPPPEPTIRITDPYDDAQVNLGEIVQGTSEHLPFDHTIWILVHPLEVGRYFPQEGPADVDTDGEFSSSVFIGLEEETGKRFDILVVLADETAGDILAGYVTKAQRDGDWPGLETLPAGAVEYDRVTVTRT